VDPVRKFSEVEYDTYTEREANASGITELPFLHRRIKLKIEMSNHNFYEERKKSEYIAEIATTAPAKEQINGTDPPGNLLSDRSIL
jgi:hypothetical protein